MQDFENNNENNSAQSTEVTASVKASIFSAAEANESVGAKNQTTPSWFAKVESLAKSVAEQAGCVLYDIDFIGAGKARTLRVFVDKEDGSVGIEECTKVTNALNEVLDSQDVIPGEQYNLEVSTPGVERVLKRKWHFEKAIGKKIWVKTSGSFESLGVTDKKWASAKQIDEVLEAIESDKLVFKPKSVEVSIPFSAIEKAHVVFVFPKGIKK